MGTTLDELKKHNKDKKVIKKWAKKYDILIASDTVIKKVPVVCGPVLNRIQKFPVRKVTCMGCCAGREDMTDDELRQNIMMCMNFLVSLLKKGWHNLKTVHIKMSMGHPIKLL